jgi:prevent-host-death family protein
VDKITGVTDLQRNIRNVLDDVVEQKTSYILTRSSRPEAVLISYDQYRQFVSGNSEDVLARIERLLAGRLRAGLFAPAARRPLGET